MRQDCGGRRRPTATRRPWQISLCKRPETRVARALLARQDKVVKGLTSSKSCFTRRCLPMGSTKR